MPLLPIVCANYHGVLSLKEGRFRAGRVPVVVLEPVQTKGLGAEDVDRLVEETRERMLRALVELSESPMGMKAMQANPERAEEDLAGLVQERAGRLAVSSGAER